jgi:UDP-glucuronate 4-epimerase
MSRYLVTGAAGFIGSHLVEALLARGDDVVAVDSFTDYYDPSLKEENAQAFEVARLDVAHDSLPLDGVDGVFHLAGQPGVRPSFEQLDVYLRRNVLATQRVLEQSGARVVYASSSSVYGNAETYPTPESAQPSPISPYGITKLACEHLAHAYGGDTIGLRYFTVYGPRQRPDMAFSRFISLARRNQPLPIHGDGNQIREFTYVDDIGEANVRAGHASVEPGTVLNLSGGTSTSVNEVLDLLENIHGRRLQIDRGKPALGDVFRTGGSTERAKALLGWEPRIRIEDGLTREYDWLAARDG